MIGPKLLLVRRQHGAFVSSIFDYATSYRTVRQNFIVKNLNTDVTFLLRAELASPFSTRTVEWEAQENTKLIIHQSLGLKDKEKMTQEC